MKLSAPFIIRRSERPSSDSLCPVSIMACGAKHCKDDNGVRAHDVKDAIGKPLCKYAMNLRMFTKKHVGLRMFKRALDGRANLSDELES
jgi:hypothetical protein